MKHGDIFVSDLSSTTHTFSIYHFCRGNSNRRKSRLGVVRKGRGTYIYLDKKLTVIEGDVVFIPENIYCYSEWWGEPNIEVVYVSCFLHYDGIQYEPQIINCDQSVKAGILRIALLLSQNEAEKLEAYSLFYRLLQTVLPQMTLGNIAFDKTLKDATEYITEHWDQPLSVADIAKACCVSESTVYHLFQKKLGQTPVRFLNAIRINIAIEYLENTPYSISTVSRMVGFSSETHFRKVFSSITGTTPLKYRKSR